MMTGTMQDKQQAGTGGIASRLNEMKAPEMGAYLNGIREELAKTRMPHDQGTKKIGLFCHSGLD